MPISVVDLYKTILPKSIIFLSERIRQLLCDDFP